MFSATILVFVVDVYDGTFLKPYIILIVTSAIIANSAIQYLSQLQHNISLSAVQTFLLFYLSACILSISQTTNHYLSYSSLVQVVCYAVTFFVSARSLNTKHAFRAMILVTLIVCGVSFAHHLIPAGTDLYKIFSQVTLSSTFGNKTYFAGYLMLIFPLIISQVLTCRTRSIQQVGFILLSLVIFYLLIKTESRSAWVALVISGIVYIVLICRTSRSRWIAGMIVLVVLIATVVIFHDVIVRRLGGIFELGPQSTTLRRLYFYGGAWKAFLSSPIIGNGIGNFAVFLPKFRSPEYWIVKSEDVVPHAHNEYLEILSETGMLGLLLFGAIIFLFFRYTLQAYRQADKKQRIVYAGFITAITGTLVDNMFSLNLRTAPVALTFWMIMGISFQQIEIKTRTLSFTLPSVLRTMRFVPLLLWTLLILWIAPYILNRYTSEKDYLTGLLLRYQQHNNDATEKFRSAVEHNPYNAEARFYLAANLVEEAQYTEARRLANELLTDYPYYPKVRTILALSSFALGDTAQAMTAITEEMNINNSPQVYSFAAEFSRISGKQDREYFYLTTQLRRNIHGKTIEYTHHALERTGKLCNELQKTVESLPLLDSVYSGFSNNVDLMVALGHSYIDIGLVQKAKSCASQARVLASTDQTVSEALKSLELRIDSLQH